GLDRASLLWCRIVGRYPRPSVLDVRVYRAAFLPALVALFVAAFSLADRPAPATSSLAADAFSTARAYGAPYPPRASLPQRAGAPAVGGPLVGRRRTCAARAAADGRGGPAPRGGTARRCAGGRAVDPPCAARHRVRAGRDRRRRAPGGAPVGQRRARSRPG